MELKGLREMEPTLHLSKKNFSFGFLKKNKFLKQVHRQLNLRNPKQYKNLYHPEYLYYLEILKFHCINYFCY